MWWEEHDRIVEFNRKKGINERVVLPPVEEYYWKLFIEYAWWTHSICIFRRRLLMLGS